MCRVCDKDSVWQRPGREFFQGGALFRYVFEDVGPASRLFRLAKNRGNRRALELLLDRAPLTGFPPSGSKLLLPVPPSKKRLILRDLSIPDILAVRLSALCGVPVSFSGIVRTSDAPQKSRSGKERRAMVGSPHFQLEPGFPTRTVADGIVLVDDLLVTGSTLRSIGRLLSHRGVGINAYLALLARGDHGNSASWGGPSPDRLPDSENLLSPGGML